MIEKHRVDVVNKIIDYITKNHFKKPGFLFMTDEEVTDLYKELFGVEIRIVNR